MQPLPQSSSAESTSLQPDLQDAERLLRDSLGQVCATDPARADTGEMIRLDEVLAIAGEAAKRAVSLRRRMRQEGDQGAPAPAPEIATSADLVEGASAGPDASPFTGGSVDAPDEHRTFRDERGVCWSVWAVHPQALEGRRPGLRGSYLNGWLAFVCEDEKRRLSPVPEGWMSVDEATLAQLCGAAEVARAETPTRRMPRVEEGGEAAL